MQSKSRKTPKLYYLVVEKNGKLYDIKFNLNGTSSSKLYLEQIDNFTSFFDNEESLIKYLFDNDIIDFTPNSIYIKHKHNKKYYVDEIIINNPLINELSKEHLKLIVEGNKCKAIKNISKVRDYLTNILEKCIKDYNFLVYLKKIVSPSLYENICAYIRACENYMEFEQYYEKYGILKDIRTNFFKMSYRTFRNLCFNVDKYDKIKNINFNLQNDGTLGFIEDEALREIYEKYDGDIEMILEYYGVDKLESLNKTQQDIVGYTLYKKRKR